MAVATWDLEQRHRASAGVCVPELGLRLPLRERKPDAAARGAVPTQVRVPAAVRRRLALLVLVGGVAALLVWALPSAREATVGAATAATAQAAASSEATARSAAALPAAAEPAWEPTVVIAPGETVWELAAPHAPAGADLQVYVEEVLRHNGLEATAIPPGTVIRLPR